ncbi:hypothetical protein NEU22_002046 [Escherichia coli]|uniref:hypothetical protein n=1 Tax=Escherichia coli TaxID=562 RepID=UPI00241128EE|nr:hypothetical protein [Escherichia coli]EJG6341288.1 hypothetical protein [Escherichia coli]EJI3260847.1 hypothetical protein [Escherichia coli]EJS8696079.1 hypothetical protein [Escherichia coli]EKG1488211.1 hypothetical protein [Escherichia coli]
MTKSWSVPFPESETEHDGMPVFWRFQATVEEDGIKIFALQYIAFHQTEHYAWLVPAHWIVNFKPAPNQWLQEWKQRRNRYAIKKVAKNAERSFAFPTKKLAIESLLRRKKYHLMRIKQDLAVVSTLVDGMKNIDTLTPDIEYNFGHNQETENWVFY